MYHFIKAEKADLKQVFDLINARMDWMVEKGIKQWDKVHYWDVYPQSYYANQVELGQLYVLKKQNEVLAAIVLYQHDPLWNENKQLDSYYLHNFVTTLKYKGIGKIIMSEVENLGRIHKKEAIRLDCMTTNQFLNDYYENMGYQLVGTCVDGIYIGNKREKLLY